MANGKGSLECSYCVHFNPSSGYPEGFSQARYCNYHKVKLPLPKREHNNRICCNFTPNLAFEHDNLFPHFIPLARRFAWFGIDMQPGVLYEFPYNQPPDIMQTAVLRVPDYNTGSWKNA